MHKIKNLTNSPFDLNAVDGKVLLPAFGEVEAEFEPDYLALLRAARTVDVKQVGNPLDHDGDGRKGGSKPASAADDEIQRLRTEYTELTGQKPHHLWKAERLQSEIDKALEA